VLSQRYPNLEYIVIDGGSTDNSVEILKSYDNRLRWISEPDGGQTNAINKGLAQCSGEIFAYLNSDDVLESDAVAKVVSFFLNHPEIGLVYGNANYIDTEDRVTGRYATAQYSFERLVHDCCICQPAAFWRSSVVKSVGQFDENLNYTMDYEYWLRIAKHGIGIEFIPDTLANSRLYPENKTMSARENIYKEIFAISLRHAGRVSQNYIQGYWHHRLWERNDVWAKLGHIVPKLDKCLIEYDSARYGGPGKTHAGAAWYLLRRIASSLKYRAWYLPRRIASSLKYRAWYLLRRIASSLRYRWKRFSKHSPVLTPLDIRVSGVFSDNWLAPRVVMSPSTARRRMLILAGLAPADCVLRIQSDELPILEQRIAANTPTRIEFAGSDKAITLEFDNSIIDEGGRTLSFRVEHTNCFSEEEI